MVWFQPTKKTTIMEIQTVNASNWHLNIIILIMLINRESNAHGSKNVNLISSFFVWHRKDNVYSNRTSPELKNITVGYYCCKIMPRKILARWILLWSLQRLFLLVLHFVNTQAFLRTTESFFGTRTVLIATLSSTLIVSASKTVA
jgi:hypothetical protein